MTQQLALLVFVGYILLLLWNDVHRREGDSPGIWLVVLWLILIGSRAVSSWTGGGIEVGRWAESYDEGNPLERWVYFFLLVGGLFTLAYRGVRWGDVFRENPWLLLIFLYWGVSVIWSDLPFVAFKRWIKDLGNIVMVMVILSDRDPVEAAKSALIRCGALLVPLSVLMIRFFPELGRTYHVWTGEMMYTGVTSHKNTLGALVLICGLFMVWQILTQWKNGKLFRDRVSFVCDFSLFAMIFWLLYMAHSATAMACLAMGSFLLIVGLIPTMREKFKNGGTYVMLGILVLFVMDMAFDLKRFVIVELLGRDMSLTTRTEVWPRLLEMNDSSLLGMGFNSFWSGDRLNEIYAELGIIQAHNGYLETYLNGGFISIVLLFALLMNSWKRIKWDMIQGKETACIHLAIFAVAVMYNYTEASFHKMGLVWFAFLLSIMRYDRPCYVPILLPAWKEQA